MLTLPAAGGHEARCLSCGRPLRNARSVARGRGPRCWSKVLKAAVESIADEYSPKQVGKASELLELGAVVPVRGRRVFRVISSDGHSSYLTAAQACNCPAGLRGRHCYHRVAVHSVQLALAA